MSDDTRKNYPHYHKNVEHLQYIDVYRILSLFNVTDPCVAHAVKKLLVAGGRGGKDYEKDLREAVVSVNRALQMRIEDHLQREGEAPASDGGGLHILSISDTPPVPTWKWKVGYALMAGPTIDSIQVEAFSDIEAIFIAKAQLTRLHMPVSEMRFTAQKVSL